LDPIDVTDLRWKWTEAIAALPADASPVLAEFVRETVGDLLGHADERNRLAQQVEALRSILEG